MPSDSLWNLFAGETAIQVEIPAPPAVKKEEEKAKKPKDPLACDPQLNAAILLLRMQLVGAHIQS